MGSKYLKSQGILKFFFNSVTLIIDQYNYTCINTLKQPPHT